MNKEANAVQQCQQDEIVYRNARRRLYTKFLGHGANLAKGRGYSISPRGTRFAHCEATPQRSYLAAYESGVWLTEDGGLSWEECVGFREVPEAHNWSFHGDRLAHVRDLRLASHDPDLIYAGIEVGGVVRSRDGGRTWKQLYGTDPDVHSLHISATRPDTVYAATAQGPYRSDDGGDTWEPIGAGLERHYTVPLTAASDNHEHVLVAVASNAGRKGAQAYLSTDAGRVWRRLELSSEDDMVVVFTWDPIDPSRVYAGTDKGKLFLSDDRGESWKPAKVDLDTIAVGAMVAARYK